MIMTTAGRAGPAQKKNRRDPNGDFGLVGSRESIWNFPFGRFHVFSTGGDSELDFRKKNGKQRGPGQTGIEGDGRRRQRLTETIVIEEKEAKHGPVRDLHEAAQGLRQELVEAGEEVHQA